MAGLRPRLLTLALLMLVFGSAERVQAQLNCTTSAAVTPTLRHEGYTELAGDLFLTCVGAPGATPTPVGVAIPQANVSVTLGATVTSRVLGGTAPQLLTEALLVVDDPSPANQDPCLSPTNPIAACVVTGDGGQTFNEPGKFNVFQGVTGGGPGQNSITFLGVPADPPAAGARTYRITNLRIDATSVPSGPFGLTPVYAFVSVSPSSSIVINSPQQPIVGFVAGGLSTTTSPANQTFSQCQTIPPTVAATVTFTENFSSAFKVKTNGLQNTPGEVYYSESGLEITVTGGTAGTADTGTRLQAVINNIPPGVSIWADNWAASTVALPGYPSDATMVTGGGTPADPGSNTITQVTNGSQNSVVVTWEITNTNPVAIDSIAFNIYASYSAGAPPTNVTATIASGFGPQYATYAIGDPIPEFMIGTGSAPANLLTITSCEAIAPAPGTVISESLVDFSWSPVSGATQYLLSVGTTPGATNIFGGPTVGTSQAVPFLPCADAGSSIYVELQAEVNGNLVVLANDTYQCVLGLQDFNHDGHPDIIWEDPTSGFAQVWYLGGAQGVSVTGAADLTQTNPWHIVAVADFNGDGNPDVVWQDPVSGAVQVWFLGGAGGNALISAYNITNHNAWKVVSVADFNRDGHPDLLWEDPTSGFAQIWYLGGAQGITVMGAADLTQTNPWHIVGTGDFNGDGVPDVLWQDPVSGTVQIWYMGGTTAGLQGSQLQTAANLPANAWHVVAVGDFNQDGHPDIVYQSPTTNAAQVFFFTGAQGTTPAGNAVLSGPNPWFIAGPH